MRSFFLAFAVFVLAGPLHGFGLMRPKYVHNNRTVQQAGFYETNWVGSAPSSGAIHYTVESNKYMTRCSGLSDYARVWVDTASGTWFLVQARPQDTNSVSFVAETSWSSASGTNVVPAVFTVEEGDQLSIYLPDATARIKLTSAGPAAGMPVRYTNVHKASGTWSWPTTASGNSLNAGLWGKGPALGIIGDSNPGSPPGYAPFLNPQQIGGMASNAWSHMLRNLYGFRCHVRNYCVGGVTTYFVDNTEMVDFQNDAPMVAVLQVGGNDVAAGTNWADQATQLLSIRSKHKGPMYLLSVLPGQAYDDTEALTRRTQNTNRMNFAKANGMFYIPLDEVVGTNRVTTGQLDDIKPEFNLDNSHLTHAGKLAVMNVLANALSAYLK